MTHYRDVKDFHLKFGVATDDDGNPHLLDDDTLAYRAGFLQEELDEFKVAHSQADLPSALDALIDLVYVAYGSALLMGVSPALWAEAWAEVQHKNMLKERATGADDARSKRKHSLDVVKPAGWTPPDHAPIIARHVKKPPQPVDRSQRVLVSGEPVPEDHSHTELKDNGQQRDYVVLSPTERAKGWVRPLRWAYVHDACGVKTTMSLQLCETYARDPSFYSGTFCCGCGKHFPVSEFRWSEDGQRVGS